MNNDHERPAAEDAPPCPKVLVIEDHDDTRILLKMILRTANYEVEAVQDGTAAIAALDLQPFDFIVSDLGLPGMSGLELMRQIRLRFDTPSIALSGYGMKADRAACLAAGFNDHVLKPINPDALIAALRRVCLEAQLQ